ncbi:MAG: DUF3054 domain-containing protein [Chloroflexi bacterium]|nr:DUF3054 domain-containing protein [Chloroflexota bacterium]
MQKKRLMSGNAGRIIVLIGDLVALLLFVYVGQRDHGTVNDARPLLGTLLSSWEFALMWIVVGWPLGAFPPAEEWTTRILLTRPILAWLVAAPLGLLLRALVLERLVIQTLFFAATLGFGLIFLFAWRLLLILGWRIAARSK